VLRELTVRAVVLAGCALATVTALSCKDDTDAKIQAAISDHAAILCERLFFCCTTDELRQLPFVDDHAPPTHDGCVAFHTTNGQKYLADTNAEEGAGRVALHVDQSDGCADRTRSLSCVDFHAALVEIHVADAFSLCNSAVVEPLVENGAPCKLYLDCKSGYCETPALGGGGADAGADVLGTCKALPGVGQKCPGAACVPGARCDPATGACVALVAAGGSCQVDAECRSGACNGGKCVSPGRCGG
jgi:hypothetical protein